MGTLLPSRSRGHIWANDGCATDRRAIPTRDHCLRAVMSSGIDVLAWLIWCPWLSSFGLYMLGASVSRPNCDLAFSRRSPCCCSRWYCWHLHFLWSNMAVGCIFDPTEYRTWIEIPRYYMDKIHNLLSNTSLISTYDPFSHPHIWKLLNSIKQLRFWSVQLV